MHLKLLNFTLLNQLASYFTSGRIGGLTLLVLAVIFTGSCGKRGAPTPPKEKVIQRAEITGFQRGNKIRISWKMPARNFGAGSVLNIDRVDIYRLAEPLTSSLTLTEDEFASRSNIIQTLSIKPTDFGGKTLSFDDQLEFAAQKVRLRYAIRFANASGQKASFSNFLLIEPAANIAADPTELKAGVAQDAITLTWSAPAANIDGSTPASILGYNVYRSASEKEAGRLLNKAPITKTEFRDEFFEFGKQYFYFVRAVSVGLTSEPVESSESNILNFKAVDTFPPSAPSSITLAAGQGVISIFFAINPEKDIAGYRIFRSTDREADRTKWELITPELLSKNTFQDTRVESGKQYFYYIIAADKAGNLSEPSEIVSETTP